MAPGPTVESASITRNKHLLRQALKERGVDQDFISAAIHSEADLVAFFDAHGERAYVLKPADSSGSAGVVQVLTLADALESFGAVGQWSFNGMCVIEEYITGQECSYEGWVQKSEPTLAAVVRKVTTTGFVEVGHQTPQETNPDAWALVQSALRAFGVEDAVFHAELKLSSSGPRLIEIALRPAGGMITDLVRLTTDIDLYAVQALIALGIHVSQPTKNGTHAAIARVVGCPQKMASPTIISEIAQLPGVIDVHQEPISAELQNPLGGNDARVGHVITHESSATAGAQAERAAQVLAVALGIDQNPDA